MKTDESGSTPIQGRAGMPDGNPYPLSAPLSILLLEDELPHAGLALRHLEDAILPPFRVKHVQSLKKALSELSDRPYDLALVDLFLPDSHGIDTVLTILQARPALTVIVLTSLDDREIGLASLRAGAQDFVVKGDYSPEVLGRSITFSMNRKRMLEERDFNASLVRMGEVRYRKLATALGYDRLELPIPGPCPCSIASRYSMLFQQNVAGVFLSTLDGQLVDFNDSFAELLGLSTQANRRAYHASQFFPGGARQHQELVKELLEKGVHRNHESELLRTDGSTLKVLANITVVADPSGDSPLIGGTIIDISERLELESRLRQKDKMEAIGRLSGGVAHDFNNLLTSIQCYAQMAQSRFQEGEAAFEDLAEIRKAADSAASLTHQLLLFSRQQIVKPTTLDVGQVVRDLLNLLRRTIGEDIELETEIAPEPEIVRADRGQMQQILMNLVINARDAMLDGGSLFIGVGCQELVDESSSVESGRYVVLTVSDTGTGMDEKTREHIFEPFFTTKSEGEGTGLGLATVYGIVQQSSGHIMVDSELGRGTTFKICLPLAARLPEDTPPERRRMESRKKGGTILVVEDDAAVRGLVEKVLETSGYRVLTAGDAISALKLAKELGDPIDLLLTDLVMPGGCGCDLAKRLVEERPDMRVILMSGYPDRTSVADDPFMARVDFLAKPFDAHSLSDLVREVLQRGTVGTDVS